MAYYITVYRDFKSFDRYRVKPSPVIEEKEETFGWESGMFLWNTSLGPKFKLKYRLVDGELDEDSVEVVSLCSTKEKC